MSKSQFDLTLALEKLHEHDWLHPTVPYDAANSNVVAKKVRDAKYADPNYWIAQCAQLLMSNYKVGMREVARILSQSGSAVIIRAIQRYDVVDYNSLQSVEGDLQNYVEGLGLS